MSPTPDTTGLREVLRHAFMGPAGDRIAYALAEGRAQKAIDAFLASDWLAAHDAEVQRVTAERIAQAIEAARDKLHPAFSTEDHGNLPRGYTNAARIAREEASRG